jgi:hypothetical protein
MSRNNKTNRTLICSVDASGYNNSVNPNVVVRCQCVDPNNDEGTQDYVVINGKQVPVKKKTPDQTL